MDRALHKQDTLHFGAIQFSYFFLFSSILGYAILILDGYGIDSGTAGMLLAFANLFSIFTQSTLANFLDRLKSIQLKVVLNLIMLGIFASIGLFFVVDNTVVISLLFLVASTLAIMLIPFVNLLGVSYRNRHYYVDFGLGRGLGSLGYSVSSFVTGQLAISMHSDAPLLVCLVSSVCFIVLTSMYRKCEVVEEHVQTEAKGFIPFMRGNVRYMMLLLGFTFALSAHILNVTFMLPAVERFGGTTAQMGIAMALMAIVELPVMFLYSRLRKYIKCSTLLKITLVFFIVKPLMIAIGNNIEIIYIAQCTQLFSYALFLPGLVEYTSLVINKEDVNKGQSCVGIVNSAAGFIGAFVGGLLINQMGVQFILNLGILLAIVGAVICLFSLQQEH